MAEITRYYSVPGFDVPDYDETRLSEVISQIQTPPPRDFGPFFTFWVEPEAPFTNEDLFFSYNLPESRVAGSDFKPIILNLGSLEANLNDGNGMFGSRLIPTVGQVDIDLAGGQHDNLCGANFRDKFFQISAGRRSPSRRNPGSTSPVIQGRTRDARWDWDRLTVLLRDESEQFKDRPDSGTYAGTGGLEGDESLKGKYKPILFGLKRFLSPVLIDPILNIYQVHFRRVEWLPFVYENLRPFNMLGDISTMGIPTIQNWTEVPGACLTDLANGLFRLGAPAQGKISCIAQAEMVYNPLTMMVKLLQTYAPLVPYNATSLTGMQPTNNFLLGFYLPPDDSRSLGQVFDEIMASINGYWAFTPLGIFTVYPLGFTPQTGILTDEEMDPRTLRRTSGTRPVWQVRAHYGHNPQPHRESEMAETGVFPPDRIYGRSEWRIAEYSDPVVKASERDAISIDIFTYLDDFSNALTVAQRVFILRGSPREIYACTVSERNFQFQIGQTWTLTSSRFGLNKDMIAIRVTERMQDRKTDIEWWG